MNTQRRTLRRGLALSVGLLLGGACHSSPDAPAQSADPVRLSFDSTVAALGAWNGVKDTTPVSPVPKPQTVLTASNGDNWVCQNTQYDDKKNLDQMLTPGLTAGVMWPGALIQGRGLIAGDPAEIPLPRSPITISIDLAVDTPSIRIQAPTSASVQSAVADLQRQADVRFAGKIDVVPALIDYRKTESFSESQASVDVGIHGAFPVKGVDFSAGVSVRDSTSFQHHTITVTLIQPMYTISFADEEKLDPNAYLADSVTAAQVQDVVNRGLIGPDNQPVYVKSVTYGRMLVFTLTNDSTASALDVQVAIGASVAAFKASTNDSVSVKNRQVMRNTDLHIQAFGGSQDSALAAIRSDSLSKFFTAVAATQAVPLSYRVNYLRDGTVALLGTETQYIRTDCAPAGTSAVYWHVRLDSATTSPNCPPDTYSLGAEVWYGAANSPSAPDQGTPFILLATPSKFGTPIKDTTLNKEIVVPMHAGVGLTTISGFFVPATSGCGAGVSFPTNPCVQDRFFAGGEGLPANPYPFTQFISLTASSAGCVAKFYWEVFTEPVLAPPARSPGS